MDTRVYHASSPLKIFFPSFQFHGNDCRIVIDEFDIFLLTRVLLLLLLFSYFYYYYHYHYYFYLFIYLFIYFILCKNKWYGMI